MPSRRPARPRYHMLYVSPVRDDFTGLRGQRDSPVGREAPSHRRPGLEREPPA